jgi:hypothetical protein
MRNMMDQALDPASCPLIVRACMAGALPGSGRCVGNGSPGGVAKVERMPSAMRRQAPSASADYLRNFGFEPAAAHALA